jgi:surfactin synthase thioesterase subunit
VVTKYYRTILLGHAQATVVAGEILDALSTDGINIKNLLMLGRDNPNVNKTVEKIINDAMKKVDGELLDIGSCDLHVVHNGFKAGMINIIKTKI